MEHDVCQFIPKQDSRESIHTINFVYETNVKSKTSKNSFYRMVLVTAGEGCLHSNKGVTAISRGDIFFLFPGVSYTIEAVSDVFMYMYISYTGVRAGEAMSKLEISSSNFIFHGYEHLISAWKTGINLGTEVSEFSSEGVLLLSFAAIGNGMPAERDSKSKAKKTVTNIKNYIDDNFRDPDLSLEKISSELFYNKKYVSHIFKSEMQVGFSDYVNTVRIQHACTLMEQGMDSIKDISAMCGFRDALYFSKIFKQYMGNTPTDHIKRIKRV